MNNLVLYPELTQVGDDYFFDVPNSTIANLTWGTKYAIICVLSHTDYDKSIVSHVKMRSTYKKKNIQEIIKCPVPDIENLTVKIIFDDHPFFQ